MNKCSMLLGVRFWFVTLIFSWSAYTSFCQVSTVRGQVKDTEQALPAVTVLLLGADSSLVRGAVSDHTGKFILDRIAPGQYLLTCSMVGYATFYSDPILVTEDDLLLPDILLEEGATELNEVVVTAEKQMFEQQIDRLVVNVQSSITSSGNTILEVLQKSPGIVVNKQNKSISMNGKSGVRVMMNNKVIQLPLDVVVQMLDGMNASNVEKIELITTPPAKYDAEGNAGIIHIVTKLDEDLGTNSSFGFTLGYKALETMGGNFNVNHRNKKLAYFLDYGYIRDHNIHTMTMTRHTLDRDFLPAVEDHSSRETVTTQQNIGAGFEWKLNSTTTLNVGVTGYRSNWDMTATALDRNMVTTDSTLITSMDIYESNIWQSASAYLGLQKALNSTSNLSVNVEYLHYDNDNPSRYHNTLVYDEYHSLEDLKIDLKKNTPIRFFIAKADYQEALSKTVTVEAGIKGVTSSLSNDVSVLRLVNNEWMIDPFFTSYSTLTEQVAAVYASAKWQFADQWQLHSGLRYEYTHTSISTAAQKDFINRKYGYFFPSIFLKKELASDKSLQFSYTKRITRPTYNDIAPYVFFWGPNTFSSGNISLLPAVSDALKLGYNEKQWIISLQFTHTRNEINSYQPEVDNQSNILTYRSQNLKYLNTIGLVNSYSRDLFSWWEIQTNLMVQYQIAKTAYPQKSDEFHLFGMNMSAASIFKLPKDIAIEISGNYQSKTVSGISQFLPIGSLNAGIQKRLGGKGTLRLSMDDILYTNFWRYKTNSIQDNLNSYFKYDFHNQFVRLTYTANLGNVKLRAVKTKTGSEEERRRLVN